MAKGVDGLLQDATIRMTLHVKPPKATHWSVRSMATAAGISYSSVQRIWHAHALKPHLVKTFKVSRDKNFAAKVEDVVGLYLNPPDKALVLCVDEKSQIQALDRTQPGLPMKKGRAGTMTRNPDELLSWIRSDRIHRSGDGTMLEAAGVCPPEPVILLPMR